MSTEGGATERVKSLKNRFDKFVTELNEDDKIILKSCESEAFWLRSLPYMIGANGAVYIYMARFYPTFPIHRRFWLHSGLAIAGWFLGKVSYIPDCVNRKAMANSNSSLAKVLKQREETITE